MEKAKAAIAAAKGYESVENWEAACAACDEAWDNATTEAEREEATRMIVVAERGLFEAEKIKVWFAAFNKPGHTTIIRQRA